MWDEIFGKTRSFSFLGILCSNSLNETLHANQEIHYGPCVQEMWLMYYFIYAILVKAAPVILIISLNIVLVKRLKVMTSRKQTVLKENENQDIHQNRRAWSVHNKTSIKEQKLASLLVIIGNVQFFLDF